MNLENIRGKAYLYCFGSKMSIKDQRSSSSDFQLALNQLIEYAKKENIKELSFDELVNFTARLTRQKVEEDGDDWDNLDSVGWHLGIWCYVWINSFSEDKEKYAENYDKIFIATWEKYFV